MDEVEVDIELVCKRPHSRKDLSGSRLHWLSWRFNPARRFLVSFELTNNCSCVLLSTFRKLDEGRAHFDEITLGAKQVRDATTPRGGNLHHGLVGLDRHERLISYHVITLVNVPSDNFSLFEAFTEIRQDKLAQ
jgi:hypothetical protein